MRNCLSETKQCIDSLYENFPDSVSEVIIVDDASDSKTFQFLEELSRKNKCKLIRNNQNLGFGISNNRAVQSAESTHVLFLNNDTVLRKGWFEPIARVFRDKNRLRNIGCVGNIQFDPRTNLLDHAGVIFRNEIPEHDMLGEKVFERKNYSEYLAVTGACFMIEKELFVSVGGFDKAYRTGFEDIDLCLRLKMLGYNHYVANESIISHRKSSSVGRHDHQSWNSKVFYGRWGKIITRFQEWDISKNHIRKGGGITDLSVHQKYILKSGRNLLFADVHVLLFWIRKYFKEENVFCVSHIGQILNSIFENSAEAIEGAALEQMLLGQYEKAILLFQECIQLNSNESWFFELIGKCRMLNEQRGEARKVYIKAIKVFPLDAGSYHGLADSQIASGKLEEAVATFRKYLLLNSESKLTWIKLGHCFYLQEKWWDAVSCFKKGFQSLEVNKDWLCSVMFHSLCKGEDFVKAWAFYNTHSDYLKIPTAILNAASVAYHIGFLELAEKFVNKYFSIVPSDLESLGLLGNIKVGMRDFEKAVECYQSCLEIAPDRAPDFSNLVNSKSFLCSWEDRIEEEKKILHDYKKGLLLPSVFDVVGLQLSEKEECALSQIKSNREHECVHEIRKSLSFKHPTSSKGKKRLGFLSSDLRNHAVGHLMVRLIECLNRDNFDVFIYLTSPNDGNKVQSRLNQSQSVLRCLHGKSYIQIAKAINRDDLDLLIDLGGFSIGNNVKALALRPSCRQAHYLGYASSMGSGLVDYIIADSHVIPRSSSSCYSEEIIRMSGCFMPPGDFDGFAKRWSRNKAKLPARGFVYCAFHAAYKMEPTIWACWMRILKAVPESVLWLKFKPSQDAIKNLKAEAVRQGIASKRIIMAEDLPDRTSHLSRIAVADLYLDCPMYNGHASSMDALHARLPLLTIKGNRFCNRVGEGFLKHLGLQQLITHDLTKYEKKAIELGLRPSKLLPLRKQIKQDADSVLSPFLHTKRFENAVNEILSKPVRVHDIDEQKEINSPRYGPRSLLLDDFTLVMIRPSEITNWANNVKMLAQEISKLGGQTVVIEPEYFARKRTDLSNVVKRIPTVGKNFSETFNFACTKVISKFVIFLDDPLRALPAQNFIQTLVQAKATLASGKTGYLGIGSSLEPNTGVLTTQSSESEKSKVSGLFAPSFILNLDALHFTGGLRPFGNSQALSWLDLTLRIKVHGFDSALVAVDTITCPVYSGRDYLKSSGKGAIAHFEKTWNRKAFAIRNTTNRFRIKQNFLLPKQIKEGRTVGIFLTLFYPDLESEILFFLSRIPFKVTIYLSTSLPVKKLKNKLEKLGHKIISNFPVKFGMDIGDFIFQLRNLELFGKDHDYYLKIHTKRDKKWRRSMLNNLLPNYDYHKIFELLDKQHFLSSKEYTYPIQYSLANKPLIEYQLKRNHIEVEDLFSTKKNDIKSLCLDSYYEYNPDLKNLSRHLKNKEKNKEFKKFLLSHYNKFKISEKHRITEPVCTNGNAKYMYPAGTMFWFDNLYLKRFKSSSEKLENMLYEMDSEVGILTNDTPTYTHFLENWFGILSSHFQKRKLRTLKSINFLLPLLGDGSASSGGFRTILKHINFLQHEGYFVTIQFCGGTENVSLQDQYQFIESYNVIDKLEKIYFAYEDISIGSDIYVATGWQTFEKSGEYERQGLNVCFFCQDLEYLFSAVKNSNNFPLQSHVIAFYKEARPTFTISKFLEQAISRFHSGQIVSTPLNVENSIYYIKSYQSDKRGICMLFSSAKKHRLPATVIQVMKNIITNFPEEPIYAFGDFSKKDRLQIPKEVRILGTLPLNKLCDLYNKCKLGTCFSTTNPSRIGFEMSACGCPCVEIDCEYTKQDLSDDLFTKCNPDSKSIYAAIERLLTDPKEYQRKLSSCVSYSSKLKFQESEQKRFSRMLNNTFYK